MKVHLKNFLSRLLIVHVTDIGIQTGVLLAELSLPVAIHFVPGFRFRFGFRLELPSEGAHPVHHRAAAGLPR